MKKLLLCFVLGVFLFSCTKDDSPTDPVEPVDQEVTFFTFTTEEEDTDSSYILLSDKEGTVLGYEKITEAKKYEFKAKKSKLSGSLLFTFATFDEKEGGYVISFEDISLYEDWSINNSSSGNYDNIEDVKFNLNIVGSADKNLYYVRPFVDLYYYGHVNDGYSYDNKSEYVVSKANKYFVTAIGRDNTKKYSFLEGIENGETRNLSYDRDFKNYEASVDVINQGEYEYVQGNVRLIENSKIVRISSSSSAKLQFPKKDAKYDVIVYGSNGARRNYQYESRGFMPTEAIKMPKYNFTITDETFFDLKFTSDIGNYGVRETTWEWDNGAKNSKDRVRVSWNLFTNDKETFKQPIIPEEIQSNFPKDFEISKLKNPVCFLHRGLEYKYKDYVYEYILPASAKDYTERENYVKEWFKNK